MSKTERTLPVPTPETAFYWEGARRGELLLQRCTNCATTQFPPSICCRECNSRDLEAVRASGRGTLHTYVINHRAAPGYAAPFVIAVVALEEGPRMLTNIVDCEPTPDALRLDMRLEVTFERLTDEISLPQFRPVGGSH